MRLAILFAQMFMGITWLAGSCAMIAFILFQTPGWSVTPKSLVVTAFASLTFAGWAEMRAAWINWRYHQTSAEDHRRSTDFAIGGWSASRGWRRRRTAGLVLFLVLIVIVGILFGK